MEVIVIRIIGSHTWNNLFFGKGIWKFLKNISRIVVLVDFFSCRRENKAGLFGNETSDILLMLQWMFLKTSNILEKIALSKLIIQYLFTVSSLTTSAILSRWQSVRVFWQLRWNSMNGLLRPLLFLCHFFEFLETMNENRKSSFQKT